MRASGIEGRSCHGCDRKGTPARTPELLEKIPEVLVGDLVVELNLDLLDDGAQFLGAALGGEELEVRELGLHGLAEDLGHEGTGLEQPDGVHDVVGKKA